jgi:cobalamin synthase
MVDVNRACKSLVCFVLLLCSAQAHADGGLGPITWESIKELWAPLLALGLVSYLLLAALSAAGFIFIALHFVLLVFLVRGFMKKNFGGKGIRYSIMFLAIGYAIVFALVYYSPSNQVSP